MASLPPVALLAGLALAACRHAPAPAPERDPDPHIPVVELDGPRCCPGGPSVEILRATRYRCAKGNSCTSLDLRVRNPEERSLFLLEDGDHWFAGYLTRVELVQTHPKDQIRSHPIWLFSGQNVHLAFKLPPGADFVIRNLDFTVPIERFVAVFFDRITLNHDRLIDSTDPEGLLPARGELDLTGITGPMTRYEGKPIYPLDGKERVAISAWCKQTLPLGLPED